VWRRASQTILTDWLDCAGMANQSPLAVREGAADRRVDLVRAAYRLFSEKGVHRVPLEEIAASAGLSKGLVIYYFKTKENLVLATMRWALDATAERVRQAMGKATTPHGKVLAMIDGIWSGAETNRRFYLLYLDLAGHAARVQHFTQLSATFHTVVNALYSEVIAQGVAEGAFAAADPEEGAVALRAIIDGLFLQWLQEADWERLHPWYRDTCKRAAVAYLTREAGSPA
jgi:TetR/AcrR family transcriptional regulator, fatty acid metabolism regulator protein